MSAYLIVAIVLIGVFVYVELSPHTFVPRSASVGCSGNSCDILPRAAPRQHIYNGAPSWYVYGPQSPPIVSYLRQQMVIANKDASQYYMNDLGLPS